MNNLNTCGTVTATLLAAVLLLAKVASAVADVRYVDVNSTNAIPPYVSWSTAATNIQDAVDAAAAGDEIVVTNGVYAAGGRIVNGSFLANRVAVDKPLTLRSINGPQFTMIQGHQVPAVINGDSAIRCVYLANGASLSGFTLTNGATRAVWDYPTNRESSGGGLWCESTNAMISNCVVVGNSAYSGRGAGAYGGTLNNCALTGNSDFGASSSTLNNCTLTGNGAGAYGSTLNNCTLSCNGYGAGSSTLNNCTLSRNGYGTDSSTLNNCALTGNSGDGASSSTLTNCTLTGNGRGAYGSTLNNCIVYFNTGENYDSSSTLNYSCTTPQPTNGMGNISLDPQLASASHLSAGSPCRWVGNGAYATGGDIDGEPWANPPSIGCDEYHPGAVTGALTVAISAYTNATVGHPLGLTALIEGRTTDSVWAFGDGFIEIDQPYTTHAWSAPGDYLVALWAFNESHPGGVSASVIVHVVTGVDGVHFVAGDGTSPMAPYTSWSTAATNIQDAVDAAVAGDEIVVTNGIYATGGRADNRVTVDNGLTLRSVNGPQFTTINGGGFSRCVYLSNGASLSGFTLTDGVALHGGGVLCESQTAVVSNCVVSGNSASTYAPASIDVIGGGAYGGTLNNCTLTGNSARAPIGYNQFEESFYAGDASGGGAAYCTLNACTLTDNSAHAPFIHDRSGAGPFGGGAYGGGAYRCTLNNCTLTGNVAQATFDYEFQRYYAYYGPYSAGAHGGGVYGSTLKGCVLRNNRAEGLFYSLIGSQFSVSGDGGGAFDSALTNCTLVGNSASNGGGGAQYSTLNNCIVCFNGWGGNTYGGFLNHCWMTDPLFVDTNAWANLRLQSNSPCINAGNNSYVTTATDLDGNPRVVGGTVDIGAYEFQSPASLISYAWLQQFNLPVDSLTDSADPDGDGVDNYHEWLAGTYPTNRFSSPAQLTIIPSSANVILTWSTNAVGFTLQSTTNLDSPVVWSTNSPAPLLIGGQNIVTNPITGPQQFYRLKQ